MLRHLVLSLVATLVIAASPQARAQDKPEDINPNMSAEVGEKAVKLVDKFHETVVRIPVTVKLANGKPHTGQMVLTMFKPAGAGPFPIVIFNHGRTSKKRAEAGRFRYLGFAGYVIHRKVALAVPTRLGYGVSGFDVDPEVWVGKGCEEFSYTLLVEAHAEQVEATVKYLRKQPWVDARRIVLAGASVGGFGSVTSAALHPEGVIGVINFVGGAGGSSDHDKVGKPCSSADVGAKYAAAGSKTRVPTLWIYAENDKLWGPKIPITWHRAYASAGGVSEFHMLPPVGDDGHTLLAHGNRQWRPLTDAFLARLGIPAPKSTAAFPPSGFASIQDASKVPLIDAKARQDGYQRFLRGNIPRAFVIAPNGGWASFYGDEEALEKALARCEQGGKRKCKPYAVDDAVVWTP